MKKITFLISALMLSLAATPALAQDTKPGELIVTYADKSAKDAAVKNSDKDKLKKDANSEDAPIALLKVEEGTEEAEIEKLLKRSDVKSVDRNIPMQTGAIPNDPKAQDGSQNHTLGTTFGSNLYGSWDYPYSTGGGRQIAVLDSGYDYGTRELEGYLADGTPKVKDWFNFVTDTSNVDDTLGHGTQMSTAALGLYNNSRQIAGASPQSSLYSYKVTVGDTGQIDQFAAIDAIYYAVGGSDIEARADVISMSFYGGSYIQAFQDAADHAYYRGAVLVSIAGNAANQTVTSTTYQTEANGDIFPAGYTNVWGIAAGRKDVNKTAGTSICGTHVDFTAPGVDVPMIGLGNVYSPATGTSAAGALAAGIVSNLEGEDPLRNQADIYRIMRLSATDYVSSDGAVFVAGYDRCSGYGRLNAQKAVANY